MEFAQRVMSSRAGTIAVAGGAAMLAGISIIVYLNRYRHSVSAQGAPVTVLVAKQPISKGTSGSIVAAQAYFTTATIRESQLRTGALSDVYRGQQLTSADFVSGATSLASTLTGTQRIMSVPLDSAHGLIGQVEAGDHVDVFIGFNVTRPGTAQGQPMLRRVMQNVPVVAVAAKGRGLGTQNSTTNVSVVVNDRQAGELAFAADNGKVWLALRPAANVKATIPATITINTEMLGLRPLAATPTTAGAYKSAFWTGR